MPPSHGEGHGRVALVEEGMTTTKIRFATDILCRLGEELNPSVDKGILELVKNAYDADAIDCVIELTDIDAPGGSISVRDNGDGMTIQDIEEGWLVLGRSSKNSTQRTRLGRIPAGSKGLGRLAALRMGTKALLCTRPRDEKNTEYNLLIDWIDYQNVDLIEDVALSIEKETRSPKSKNGTEITIENIQHRITRSAVRRLAREILLLAGPFGDDHTGFRPVLVAPEFKDLESLVKNKYFNDADYHLECSLSEKGLARAAVVDWRGAELFSAEHSDLATGRDAAPYKCPALVFDLWAFILNKESFATKSVNLADVRPWLQEFGGVHIYQNGLRVTPYGDPGNDWLDMNLRRSQSPEERPSTNNSIGRVNITDTTQLLIQKTDRSGFMETEAFIEIRALVQDALEWMAKRRLDEAEKRRTKARTEAPAKTAESKKQLDAAIEKLPRAAKEPVKKAVNNAWNAVGKEMHQYQQEIQLYRTLSTVGITSAIFAHESSGSPIKVISQSIGTIERRAKTLLGKEYDAKLAQPVQGISIAVKGLAVLGNATLKLLDHEKRRIGRVDVHRVIENVLATFQPFLAGRSVQARKIFCEGSPYLRGSEAAVESVVTNLLNNSIAAFECSEKSHRMIEITTVTSGSTLRITIADSGPGIDGISLREIWLPGRTTRKNGTGLGLTIVRDTVKDLGGNVDAIETSALGGAEIIVELPIIGV